MFADHQPRISQWGRANPHNFVKVCEFAIGTIRVHLRDAAEAVRTGEYPSAVFFGSKLNGLSYLTQHADSLYQDAEEAHDDAALMAVFMRIPSIGVAKAGFCCQMLYNRVGCLDTHNIVRFGLSPRSFRIDPDYSARTRWHRIQSYIDTCAALGGCERLWNGWCEYVAEREGDKPDHISNLHTSMVT
jgi:hypothetical protein